MAKLSQSDVDKKEVADWNQRFEICRQQRLIFEQQWYTNIAMFQGRQYATWQKKTPTGARFVDPPVPQNRVRLVINKIRPIIRKEFTKLTKEEPIFYAAPASSEPEDIHAAQAAEALNDFILYTAKFRSKRSQATLWSCLTGTGYLKSFCDDRQTIDISSPPTFHLYVPLLQEVDIEKQPYVIEAKAVSVETIRSFYGADVEPTVGTSGTVVEQKFFGALGITPEQSSYQKMVFVKEIWVKPEMMPDYPKGALLVMAGNQFVYRYTPNTEEPPVGEESLSEILREQDQDNPFDIPKIRESAYPFLHGEYPYKVITHIPSGSFYGTSIIEDLISPQRELNKTRSQIVEIKNRVAKPHMLYPEGAINPKKVTAQAGQMIPLRSGFSRADVGYMETPNISYVFDSVEDRINGDMDFIASQSEISRGGAPTGVEAASAIAYIQEQNDTALDHTIKSIEDAIIGVGKQCLSLAQQFWPEDKVIRVVSKNNELAGKKFKLSSINDDVDLRIQVGSIIPQSMAAKRAFITELMDRGLPLYKGLRYLQMTETDRLYEELQIDAKQAQREHEKMKEYIQIPIANPFDESDESFAENISEEVPNTEPYPVNPWDNHPIHMEEHGMFMKSNEFEILDPQIQQVFVNHWLMHEQAYLQEMSKLNAGATGQPGPGQSGEPNSDPGNSGS